jgi:tetratricopeptide (TPR) repeat protein
MANGRLHRANEAANDLKSYDAAVADLQKSSYADMLPRFQLYRTEMVAWQQFGEGKNDAAVATMRTAAEEQDKLGQAEVDLPAREMLGDMLLELKRPDEALVEYKVALTLSPNRLNGMNGAGLAAEALGKKKEAGDYYSVMLKNTDDGAHSSRPSLVHAKEFVTRKVADAE